VENIEQVKAVTGRLEGRIRREAEVLLNSGEPLITSKASLVYLLMGFPLSRDFPISTDNNCSRSDEDSY